MKLFDTIAAVSTPRGKGGVAVIRISGENAVAGLLVLSAEGEGISRGELCPDGDGGAVEKDAVLLLLENGDLGPGKTQHPAEIVTEDEPVMLGGDPIEQGDSS